MPTTPAASLALATALSLLCVAPGAALSQTPYPSKSIRLLLGFPPSGGVDTLARLLGAELSETLGQPIVIENRTGAGSNIALAALAKAAPDGYTLGLTTPAVTINPALYARPGYDALRDFAPIGQVAADTYLMAVHPGLPVTSVRELVALAKKKPGELNYASSGNGGASHLAGAMLATATGMQVTHVPFKGNPAAIMSVMSGDTHFVFGAPSSITPQAEAGKLRIIAATSATRSALFPDYPTVAESGVPGYESLAWYGLLAPAGTPADRIARLSQALQAVMAKDSFRQAMARSGFEARTGSPQEFQALMRSELEKWGAVVKQTGMKLD